jgi:hypothetical protein
MRKGNEKGEQAYKTLMFLWFSLLILQGVMAFMIWFVKPELYQFDISAPIVDGNFTTVAVFGALGFALFAGSFFLRKAYLAQSVAKQKVELVQTALVTACALCEAITLFGVFLGIAFNYAHFYLFIAYGIFGTLLHMPRRHDVHAASYNVGR